MGTILDEFRQDNINILNEKVNHPRHYGGNGNAYETIKVIEAWGLGFNLGNVVKYISRAGKKGAEIEDLEKARWYLEREIALKYENAGIRPE